MSDELSLSAEEKRQGWVLACVRTATTDLVIEAEDLGDVTLAKPKTIPCRIHTLEKLALDVIKVTLRLPPSSTLNFYPGQYVDIIGTGGIRRSYSLACAPQADNMLELHIKKVTDGAMSQYWFEHAKVNDLLRLNGPLGTFLLRDLDDLHLVFLATGTGIAPIKAMLEDLDRKPKERLPRSVTVYWGGRVPDDLYWRPGQMSYPYQLIPVLSRANADWIGKRGHVQNALIEDGFDLAGICVYACGSDAMIHSAQSALQAAGLPAKRFLADAFVCSATN